MAALPKEARWCGCFFVHPTALIDNGKKRMEARAMRKRMRGIIHGLMCRFNRHEYIVRLTFSKAGCDLKTCRHCGKAEVTG
jgi:hypothetical protein